MRRGLRVVASLGLLAVTAALVDVREIGTTLAGLSWLPVVAALGVSVPQLAITAWRWCFTARRMDLPLPFLVAWREYYASALLNLVLPGGVLGDASRVLRLSAAARGGAGKIARCVVIERTSGQVALWLLIAVGAIVYGAPRAPLLTVGALVGVAASLVGLRWIFARPAVADTTVGAAVRRFVGELRATLVDDRAWAVQLSASLAAVALLGVMFGLCIVAVGAPMRPGQVLLVAPLVLAASALPISVGGWGVREATSAGLFGLLGLSATQGAAAAAAFGAVSLVGALPGAGVLLLVPPPAEES